MAVLLKVRRWALDVNVIGGEREDEEGRECGRGREEELWRKCVG